MVNGVPAVTSKQELTDLTGKSRYVGGRVKRLAGASLRQKAMSSGLRSWSSAAVTGKPDAVKVARPVWSGGKTARSYLSLPSCGDQLMEWIAPVVVFVGVIAIWLTVTQIRERLVRNERKLNALLQHFSIHPPPALSDRVKDLARDPLRKIEAIKVYREETGASLAEAKEAVEAFINSK